MEWNFNFSLLGACEAGWSKTVHVQLVALRFRL